MLSAFARAIAEGDGALAEICAAPRVAPPHPAMTISAKKTPIIDGARRSVIPNITMVRVRTEPIMGYFS